MNRAERRRRERELKKSNASNKNASILNGSSDDFEEGLIMGVTILGQRVINELKHFHGWATDDAEKFIEGIVSDEDFLMSEESI